MAKKKIDLLASPPKPKHAIGEYVDNRGVHGRVIGHAVDCGGDAVSMRYLVHPTDGPDAPTMGNASWAREEWLSKAQAPKADAEASG